MTGPADEFLWLVPHFCHSTGDETQCEEPHYLQGEKEDKRGQEPLLLASHGVLKCHSGLQRKQKQAKRHTPQLVKTKTVSNSMKSICLTF